MPEPWCPECWIREVARRCLNCATRICAVCQRSGGFCRACTARMAFDRRTPEPIPVPFRRIEPWPAPPEPAPWRDSVLTFLSCVGPQEPWRIVAHLGLGISSRAMRTICDAWEQGGYLVRHADGRFAVAQAERRSA